MYKKHLLLQLRIDGPNPVKRILVLSRPSSQFSTMPLPTIKRIVFPVVEGRPFRVHVVSLLARGNLSFNELFAKVAPLVMLEHPSSPPAPAPAPAGPSAGPPALANMDPYWADLEDFNYKWDLHHPPLPLSWLLWLHWLHWLH